MSENPVCEWPASETELYVSERDHVFRYLVAHGRDPFDADDLTQEAFLRLHECCALGQTVKEPLPWLIVVARHLRIDRVRHSQYEVHTTAQWKLVVETKPHSMPTPEESVLTQDLADKVYRAIGTLSGQERDCLALRLKGMTLREIGKTLGISMWLVRERVDAVLLKIRRRIEARPRRGVVRFYDDRTDRLDLY